MAYGSMSASQGSILSSFDPMDNEAVENLIIDDEQLRGCGFPQQLLIALRSVGYKTVQILQLPPPNLSPSGEILNEYWYDLRNRGVPQSVLPSRLFDQRPPTRAEQELNSYASLAASYTHIPSTQGGAGAASFDRGALRLACTTHAIAWAVHRYFYWSTRYRRLSRHSG